MRAPPPTHAARWRRVQDLFDAALDVPAAARDAWLATVTDAEAPGVVAEVRALLDAHAATDSILDDAPVALLAGLALAPDPEPAAWRAVAGARVGPFTLDRPVGSGGMGVVWTAWAGDDSRVAVKLLTAAGGRLRAPERFRREIHIGGRLQHPHLLPVLDAGETGDGVPWFAMPYVAGETLHARLGREPRLPVAIAVRLAGQVAGALAHAHALGVVHRDVKPANVLLDAAGDAFLADFGIAHALEVAGPDAVLTLSGALVGTPRYLAPERVQGAPPDGRDDVWALGCMLYEMLTGQPPYRGAAHVQLLAGRPVPAPDARAAHPALPLAVDRLLRAALAPARADRVDATTLAARLADALDAA